MASSSRGRVRPTLNDRRGGAHPKPQAPPTSRPPAASCETGSQSTAPTSQGSCGIDRALLDASGILPNQYIELYNISNGERFSTYVIEAARGSGTISLNGAAARKAMVGDLLIICAYSQYTETELATYQPVVVLADERNQPHKATGAMRA